MPIRKDYEIKKYKKNYFCNFIKKNVSIFVCSLLFLILFPIILIFYGKLFTHNHPSQTNQNNNFNSVSNKSIINNTQEILEKKELDEFVVDGKHDAPTKIARFIKNCRDGILLHKENLVLSENPKISVIIPVYNRANYISNGVRSCQNQKMKDIEIIIIDDLSNDNSVEIIKKLQKEDPRIQLIENKKRKGPLNNRYVGTTKAKGKYVTYLDNDDLFLREDLFDTIYNEAEQGNYDIISFDGFISVDFRTDKKAIRNLLYTHKRDLILTQPELGDLLYKYTGTIERSVVDGVFWGKLVKRDVMLKAFELLGPKIYTKFWTRTEDVMASYALFKVAKNFKSMEFKGIYYLEGFKRFKNTDVDDSVFNRRYEPYKHLNWVEALLYMVKIYPKDTDILLYQLYSFKNYFKNCFYKELKEDSLRILNGILELDNIKPKDRNKINGIIKTCKKRKENN